MFIRRKVCQQRFFCRYLILVVFCSPLLCLFLVDFSVHLVRGVSGVRCEEAGGRQARLLPLLQDGGHDSAVFR